MIIGFCLGIMILITMLSIVMGSGWGTDIFNETYNEDIIVNGTTNSIEIGYNVGFYIDPILVGIVILVGLIAVAVILGINVLGSGVTGEMGKFIIIMTAYIGLWGMLTVLAFPLIASIEILGFTIYAVLSLGYVIGIFKNYSGGGD